MFLLPTHIRENAPPARRNAAAGDYPASASLVRNPQMAASAEGRSIHQGNAGGDRDRCSLSLSLPLIQYSAGVGGGGDGHRAVGHPLRERERPESVKSTDGRGRTAAGLSRFRGKGEGKFSSLFSESFLSRSTLESFGLHWNTPTIESGGGEWREEIRTNSLSLPVTDFGRRESPKEDSAEPASACPPSHGRKPDQRDPAEKFLPALRNEENVAGRPEGDRHCTPRGSSAGGLGVPSNQGPLIQRRGRVGPSLLGSTSAQFRGRPTHPFSLISPPPVATTSQ